MGVENGRKHWATAALIVFMLGLAAMTGCSPQQQSQQGGGQQEEQRGPSAGAAAGIATEQWLDSAHSQVVTSPAGEEFCVSCHDGGAFAEGVGSPAELDRDYPVSTDCRACHTGRGSEFFESQTTSIPTAASIKAGTGTVCVACHRLFEEASADATEYAGPHYSSQSAIWSGTGGLVTGTAELPSTRRHRTIENACVGCHMTEKDGVANHDVKVGLNACTRCHKGLETFDRPAKGDYDGDGRKEGFQTEVDGLMTVVQSAVASDPQGGPFVYSRGNLVFGTTDTQTAEPSKRVSQQAYVAAYNWRLVQADRSRGIHNPSYTVALLQWSYRNLTGRDVPNATIME